MGLFCVSRCAGSPPRRLVAETPSAKSQMRLGVSSVLVLGLLSVGAFAAFPGSRAPAPLVPYPAPEAEEGLDAPPSVPSAAGGALPYPSFLEQHFERVSKDWGRLQVEDILKNLDTLSAHLDEKQQAAGGTGRTTMSWQQKKQQLEKQQRVEQRQYPELDTSHPQGAAVALIYSLAFSDMSLGVADSVVFYRFLAIFLLHWVFVLSRNRGRAATYRCIFIIVCFFLSVLPSHVSSVPQKCPLALVVGNEILLLKSAVTPLRVFSSFLPSF